MAHEKELSDCYLISAGLGSISLQLMLRLSISIHCNFEFATCGLGLAPGPKEYINRDDCGSFRILASSSANMLISSLVCFRRVVIVSLLYYLMLGTVVEQVKFKNVKRLNRIL